MGAPAPFQRAAMSETRNFIGRKELLTWLNATLRLDYTKVEQCCSGVAHCQIVDIMYPGSVKLDKMIWDAHTEVQYLKNFQILEAALMVNNIARKVDMARLVKGKFQDNLEFCQWMKAEWDKTVGDPPPEYDPVAVRETHLKRKQGKRHTRKLSGSQDLSNLDKSPMRNPHGDAPSPRRAATNASSLPTNKTAGTRLPSRKNGSGDHRVQELEAKLKDLQEKADLDAANIANLVKERDFYFDKLRKVEIKIQELDEPKPPVVLEITEILYAVEEGFDVPQDRPE